MLKILTILLCFATYANATTIAWDHDCANADGFYVFRVDGPVENPKLYVKVDCPATEASVFFPGYYTVSAYNQDEYSTHSNTILLAQYYYNCIKSDYDASGRLIYRGEHTTYNAASDDANWVVTKYYYDTNGFLIEMKIRTISWDTRTTGWD